MIKLLMKNQMKILMLILILQLLPTNFIFVFMKFSLYIGVVLFISFNVILIHYFFTIQIFERLDYYF